MLADSVARERRTRVFRITLIEGDLPTEPISGQVGFLLEIAPDASLRAGYPGSLGLAELIGGFDDARLKAHSLAQALITGEPPLRGLRQLTVFEETVIGELQHALHTIHLHDILIKRKFSQCVFVGHSRFADGIEQLSRIRGIGPRVIRADIAVKVGKLGRIARSFTRLQNSRFDTTSLRSEWHQFLETIDPFGLRHHAMPQRRTWQANEIWFYTTAYTFTNAGLLYEPYFPQPFRFLVDNYLTGGQPLRDRPQAAVDYHQFAKFEFIPSKAELSAARKAIVAHLEAVPLEGRDALARALFVGSNYFKHIFLSRLLSKGLQLTRLMDHWVESVRPAAVVGGNTVFEAYALLAASKAGIPTVVLQHGLFLDYCQFLDPPSDRYFVRGPFWRDFLAPGVQPKAMVLDPPHPVATAEMHVDARRTIVFLTQPFVLPFFHEVELDDLLEVMICCAADAGVELCVRVHPMETVAHYRSKVTELVKQLGRDVEVTYSQGPGLDDVLARSAVAVTYFSTVFQDCLRHRVPVISLDWHDFACKAQMTKFQAFIFARSLAELRQLVSKGVAGKLTSDACDIQAFLANTPAPQLRMAIAKALQAPSRQHHATAA
jgi:hypothetical protein